MWGHRTRRLLLPLVFLTAFTARLATGLHLGGLFATRGYDDAVYYAAADALAFGHLPYRDFVFLHPPGIVLGLLPFAELGRLTHDGWGFAAARLGWMAIGALNATLAAVVARRYGAGAAVAAGLFYALWPPILEVESITRLEPLVSLCLLAGWAMTTHPRLAESPRWQVAAGLALGLAPAVKVWALVPVLVIAVWTAVSLPPRGRLRLLLATAGGTTLVCLPFFVLAPGDMWRLVVSAQLGRTRVRGVPWRWHELAGLSTVPDPGGPLVAGAVIALLGVAVLLLAWRRGARLPVVLALVQLAVLFSTPSFFNFYPAYVLPAFAVCCGAAAAHVWQALARVGAGSRAPGRARVRTVAASGVAALASAVLLLELVGVAPDLPDGRPFPSAKIWPAVHRARCVTADSPQALIQLDIFSRNLRRGCPVVVDVTGLSLEIDPGLTARTRRHERAWQEALLAHLDSGKVAILMRPSWDGFSNRTARKIRRWPVLASWGPVTARRTHRARVSPPVAP